MLGDLCEELYAAPQEAASAGDVLGDLAAEAAAFRKGTGDTAAWFRPVRIKNNCMGVIAVNPAHPQAAQVDVLHIVDLAFRRMVAAGQGNTRKVLRMWPLPTPVFPLALPVIRLAAQQLTDLITRTMADGTFPSERPVRVAISFKARSVAAPSADKLQLLTAMPPVATSTSVGSEVSLLGVPASSSSPARAASPVAEAGTEGAVAAAPVAEAGTEGAVAAAPVAEAGTEGAVAALSSKTPTAAASSDAVAEGAGAAAASSDAVTEGAGAAAASSDAVTEGTLMTRDVVTPLMCEEVKRIMGEHGLPFVLVYKGEHVTIEMQALQSIAGAYAVLTHQHDLAARFNMQKLPACTANAQAAQSSAGAVSSSEQQAEPAAGNACE